MAIGLGMGFVSITIAATNGVPPRESGLASGLINTSQQIGGSVGLAILSGVEAWGVKTFASLNATAGPALQAEATVVGFKVAFVVGAGFALLAFLIALFFVHQFPENTEQAAEDVPIPAGGELTQPAAQQSASQLPYTDGELPQAHA
jgi:MFS family permease